MVTPQREKELRDRVAQRWQEFPEADDAATMGTGWHPRLTEEETDIVADEYEKRKLGRPRGHPSGRDVAPDNRCGFGYFWRWDPISPVRNCFDARYGPAAVIL